MHNPEMIEAVTPCSGQYSFKRDLRLNAWLMVAMAVYMVQLAVLKRSPNWPAWARGALALAPVIPGLLYLRSWVRFVRGLDELQRRVQFEAHIFAAWGTIVAGVIVATLTEHGVLGALPRGLGFLGVVIAFFPLWTIGVALANRRYK